LSAKRPPRTSVVYRIADPLRRYSPERAFEQIVAPQWEAFCGEGFERLCREALPLLYAKEGVSGHFEVGEYWDRTVQIDIVGLRADMIWQPCTNGSESRSQNPGLRKWAVRRILRNIYFCVNGQ
jgi:hypothetical protein